MYNKIVETGNFLKTITFFNNDQEIGHIRYWYNDSEISKKDLLNLFKKHSENAREVMTNFPAECLDEHSLYLHYLWVEKEFRYNGVGAKLLEMLITERFKGLNEIVLAYDDSKQWLVPFYIKNISSAYCTRKNVILFYM